MESRKASKIIVSFAKKQWRENKPKSVEARRIKDEKVMKFDFPLFAIKNKILVRFIVCVEYWDTLRVFQFSSTGNRLGAKNFERPFEIKNEIRKKSTLIDKFPRKRPSYL